MATETKNPGEKKLSVSQQDLDAQARVEQASCARASARPYQVGGRRKGKAPRHRASPKARGGAGCAPPRKGRRPAPARSDGARAGAVRTAPAPRAKPSGVVLRTLTEEERSARAHALPTPGCARPKSARRPKRRPAAAPAARRSTAEREAAEARKREEDERRRHEEETKRKAEQEAKKRFGGEEEAQGRGHARTPSRR